MADLVNAASTFAIHLFRELTQPDKNVVFSPASIYVALGMTSAGARNATLEQLGKCLGISDNSHLHGCMQKLSASLHPKHATVELANRLFSQVSGNILPEFIQVVTASYEASLEQVDYKGDANGALSTINSWVAKLTHDRIKSILEDGSVDAATVLVIVNAIYFKGSWASKFDSTLTVEDRFHLNENDHVSAHLMRRNAEEDVAYSEELNSTLLKLPYLNDELSMLILLPSIRYKLADVESKLTMQALENVQAKLHKMKTNLFLPRFRLEETYDLRSSLCKMGVSDMFDMNKADLSGIDGTRLLYVSKVAHRAFIEVNEEGTEAAAATAVAMKARSMPRVVEFRADHPFLFFIQHNESKMILFMGRVTRP